MGDLILTAYGASSRNTQVGKRIGIGESLASIIAATGYTPEGVNSATSLYMLAQKLHINLPLCCSVYDVLYNGMHVQEIIGILRS
jgi:glycerol-3-phosphate dehydrogenase (NAD(P)+)